MVTKSVRALKLGTRVIFQSREFPNYNRNGTEAKILRYGEEIPEFGILHYIQFDDGTETGAKLDELTPIQ